MGLTTKHWVPALLFAAVLHLIIVVQVYRQPDPLTAEDEGQQAITIALAPEPAPEPEAKPDPKPEAKPKPEPEPKPEPKPKPKPAPKPKPEPTPVPEPEPELEPEPTPVPEPEPTPEPTPRPEPETTQPEPPPAEPVERAAEQTQTGATGGIRDMTPDYRSQLSAWLERHKEYPRRARRLGQEGTAVLHFVIDRSGKVLEWELRNSSGHRLLDSAVEKMIRRANPLPTMPDSMTISRLELTVPVNFSLR